MQWRVLLLTGLQAWWQDVMRHDLPDSDQLALNGSVALSIRFVVII